MLELQVPFHPRKKSSILIPCKNLCRLGKSPWQLSKLAVLGMEPWLMAGHACLSHVSTVDHLVVLFLHLQPLKKRSEGGHLGSHASGQEYH